MTHAYYSLISSLFTHICSHYAILYHFFFQDIGNDPLCLQSHMISEGSMVQQTHQLIKLKYPKPCYYCQHEVLLFPNESQPPLSVVFKE